jgi:hypothetical protein
VIRPAVVAVAALLTACLPVSTAAAAGPTAPTRAAAQPTNQLELVDQTTWVTGDQEFRAQVRVTGAPDDAVLRLGIYARLSSRSAFDQTLAGNLGLTRASPPDQPLHTLPPTTPGVFELSYPVGSGGAGLDPGSDFGVYPVEILLVDPTGQVLDQIITYLLLMPAPDVFPPLAVALVFDVGAPPGLQPDGRALLTTEELTQIENRVNLLTSTPGIPVTVAPVPETLDALAELGPPDDALLDELSRAFEGREVAARPYVDLDVEAMRAAELTHWIPAEADAGAQVMRSIYDLEPAGDLWLADTTVRPAEISTMSELGVGRAIVPSRAIAEVPGPDEIDVPRAPVALSEGGPLALVSDDDLTDRLLGEDGRLDAQRALAELTLIWHEAPSRPRGVAIRIADQAPLDLGLVQNVLQGMQDSTVLQPVTVDEMFADLPALGGSDQPTVVELAQPEENADIDLGGLTNELDRARAVVSGLAGMLDESQLIRSLQRSLLVAPGSRTPTDERQGYLTRIDGVADELVAAIGAPEEFRITLTSREGTVPLTVANTSDETVTVTVQLTSSQLEFPQGDELTIDVPPGGTREDIEVRTRTSGAFPLGITVTTPDRSLVLDRTTFTIRSTAISGVGLVLSIGAGLFLLIWWARHWRTTRRSSRLVSEEPPLRAASARVTEVEPSRHG